MALVVAPQPSANQVKKAGSRLRKHARGDRTLTDEELGDVLDCITRWRASFSQPLVSANNSLRWAVRSLEIDAQVTQRLKRMSTILEKVTERETTCSVDRMRDIGGCRVVVSSLDDVYNVAKWLRRRRPILEEIDYITTPRASGYRALHVVAEYGRTPKPIEVQIRTQPMHRWALLVEEQSSIQGVNYKQDGEGAFQRSMRGISHLVSKHESGEELPQLVTEALRDLQLIDYTLNKEVDTREQ
ncbi:RelA/SpoT domain-containing protein [Tessaracoccus palaemonis]|uniref:RelA/SpoT domain-containing protein n=1 Tax=Tessaracoccus palaemonis TaxID=2829499 RepID=A0ABX8SHM1_9ACTN|nr:RelA/SpoT domain-containing protein [Tessaracoccus palaemonis]QXT62768.1 RelA/SpoT domain-containing protein [Tessaracoccus palaemonis]